MWRAEPSQGSCGAQGRAAEVQGGGGDQLCAVLTHGRLGGRGPDVQMTALRLTEATAPSDPHSGEPEPGPAGSWASYSVLPLGLVGASVSSVNRQIITLPSKG